MEHCIGVAHFSVTGLKTVRELEDLSEKQKQEISGTLSAGVGTAVGVGAEQPHPHAGGSYRSRAPRIACGISAMSSPRNW